jgi:hypothetical protein
MSYSMLNHTSRGVFSNRIFKQVRARVLVCSWEKPIFLCA